MSTDPFPSNDEMQAANAGLVALVRRRFPMGFYSRDTNWSQWSAAALVRMADTVEAAMRLMQSGNDVDGRTLVRSLYEQVVTLAWVAIDPGPHYSRWLGQALWNDLQLHNDAEEFGVAVMSPGEVAHARRLLGLTENEGEQTRASECGVRRARGNRPAADRLLPPVPERAHAADEHWSRRIEGLHPPRHMLSFRGLYPVAFRVPSRAVHGAVGALGVYITDRGNRRVVHLARREGRLMWALVGPLFGMGLTIAAQDAWWIDESEVRALVDRATGPEQ
jgi:hypothetical protein